MNPLFAIIDAPIIGAVVVIALLLFGADKIPKLARSMGEAKREFEAGHRTQPPAEPHSSESPGQQPPQSPTSQTPPAQNPPSQTPASPQ
jgi:sec-independent protein translocase protein TatA